MRLQTLLVESDGFRLAEQDLAQRGPGEVLGLKQAGHGATLQVAVAAEAGLLEAARSTATRVLESGCTTAQQYLSALHCASTPLFRPQDAL